MATTDELNYVIGSLTAERQEQTNGTAQAPFNKAIAIVANFRDNGTITQDDKNFVLGLLEREKLGEYGDNADRRSFVRSIEIVNTIEVPTAE